MLHCRHDGCRVKFRDLDAAGLAAHEAKPHVRCTCGKYLPPGSIRAHLSGLARCGRPHPPPPPGFAHPSFPAKEASRG
jgi:hypothetical protein